MAFSELDEAFALTRAQPELKTIASDEVVRRVLKHNPYTFWGLYPAESGTPLLGYYGFLLLNTTGAAALVADRLDPLNPSFDHLAGEGQTAAAVYIWMMVAPGLTARATPMVTAALGAMNRGAPLYARAGTQAGLNLIRRQGFKPVHAERDGLGGLFLFGAIDSLEVRPTRQLADDAPLPFTTGPAPVAAAASRFAIKVASTNDDVERALAIRAAVYMVEQHCPYEEEFDGNDRCATHLLGSVDGEPAATLRLRYFADFAKIERVAVLPRYRHSLIGREMMKATLEFIRRKGYRKVYGHVQKRLVHYWSRYGFKPLDTNYTLRFSDHEYVLMWGDLEPHPKALTMHTDPYVLLRPEGQWDEPCALERSAQRPATNPH